MTITGKFIADIQRTLKYDRQQHGGKSDYERIVNQLRSLFERTAIVQTSLADAVFEYWENEYIFNSSDKTAEPTDENVDKLSAFLSFLNNEEENREKFSEKDWQEIGELVNYEAEDMPLDQLQNLMQVLVAHGAY
jgi:hypothetical protein